MSRYTRDEIIHKGLDLLGASTINQHDRPGGILDPNAFSISWLQQAMDMYHNRFPFAGDILDVLMNITSGQSDVVLNSDNTLYLPLDFILDCKDGIVITIDNSKKRLRRKGFQPWLDVFNNTSNTSVQFPFVYTIINRPKRFKVAPVPRESYTATLWYFSQPVELEADSYPEFPDEWSLVEFVRIKGGELIKRYDPGTATGFMDKEMGRLKSAGLIHEGEYDQVTIENNAYADQISGTVTSWMGVY